MRHKRFTRRRGLLAVGVALTLVAAACANDDDDVAVEDEAEEVPEEDAPPEDGDGDFEGAVVSVFGPEVEEEQQSLQNAFADFEAETGITVDVAGSRDADNELGVRVDGGNPPDISMLPQPGRLAEFADDIVPLPDDVVATVEENFDEGLVEIGRVDGELLAVPAKADLKSLVWYSPSDFEENGYEVPETFDEFLDLIDQVIEDGNTAFSQGIESGDATGWPFTDWVEDFMLRLKGPDVYDQWWQHEIPFDDPDVVEVGEFVMDMWERDGFLLGGPQFAASTPFGDAGLPLLDGDALMHRQSNFYAAIYIDNGAELGPDGDIDAFFLPGSDENPNITLSGGIYATPFSDRPEVIETMRFIASEDFANARASQDIGGFLSPNQNVDTSLYPTELEQSMGEILAAGEPVRFDASDLMPGAVGAGSFWSAAVDLTTGASDVPEAFTEVEASWPG